VKCAPTTFGCTVRALLLLCWGLAGVGVALSKGVAAASEPESDAQTASQASMVLVVGAPGANKYESAFADWGDRWLHAAELGAISVTLIGRDTNDTSDRERLREALVEAQQETDTPLWIVLIGHGTFDGRSARFNLRGTDVSANDLADWLSGIARPLAVINCSSASGPFVNRLAGEDRVIITATKSGGEVNFSRFGEYLSLAVSDLEADLDKDGQVSLLEAFLMASRRTEAYYEGQGQLSTEHALLEDNGDGRGVRADFFTGVNPTKKPEAGVPIDGRRAHQWHLLPSAEERRLSPEIRRRRDDRKSDLAEEDYYDQLEVLAVEIARLYAAAEESPSKSSSDGSEESNGTARARPAPNGKSEAPGEN